jgi:hypothetical protein
MHDKNIYKSDAPDIKILPLTTSLKKGTEIEECEAKEWKVLETRTKERITHLARDMSEKGLIKTEDGTPQKIPLFKDLWVNRHSQYGPKEKVTKPTQKTKRPDVFSTDYLPPDKGPNFRIPTAKVVSKGLQPSSTTTVSTTSPYPYVN